MYCNLPKRNIRLYACIFIFHIFLYDRKTKIKAKKKNANIDARTYLDGRIEQTSNFEAPTVCCSSGRRAAAAWDVQTSPAPLQEQNRTVRGGGC